MPRTVAFADLRAARQAEFRQHLSSEEALTALAGPACEKGATGALADERDRKAVTEPGH